MGEIASSISEAIRNRATSTVLVTFSIFYIGYHWERFYVMFFVDQDIIFNQYGLLKNEYLEQNFFGFQDGEAIWGIVIPLVLTFLFIWPLQRLVLIHAYRIEQKSKTARRKVKFDESREIEKYKNNLLKLESKTIDAEASKIKAESKLSKSKIEAAKTDPSIIWEEEYSIFKKSRHFANMNVLIEVIYEDEGRNDGSLSADTLAYLDTEGLITFGANRNYLSMTAKGKFFIKKFQLETKV